MECNVRREVSALSTCNCVPLEGLKAPGLATVVTIAGGLVSRVYMRMAWTLGTSTVDALSSRHEELTRFFCLLLLLLGCRPGRQLAGRLPCFALSVP